MAKKTDGEENKVENTEGGAKKKSTYKTASQKLEYHKEKLGKLEKKLEELKDDIEAEKKVIEELEKKASRSQRNEKLKSLSNAQLDAAMSMTPEMLEQFKAFMASQQK